MLKLRPAHERGGADHGWLKTWHTFSFASYYDPRHMGFRSLRVINDDTVQPGRGFGTHPHDNMEIITYVLRGALAHKDSMGHESVLNAGEVQAMSAGTGLTHSEYNHSSQEAVHLVQIWIEPDTQDVTPRYAQRGVPDHDGRLVLIASPQPSGSALPIHQDARVYLCHLSNGQSVQYALDRGRGAWLQMLSGNCQVNTIAVQTGDGLAIETEAALSVTGTAESEFLLFDLA